MASKTGNVELTSATSTTLRSLGLNEKWLQSRIAEDPSILGLGDLEVFSQEYAQPTGGRIDFLLYDRDTDTYYEVEVMLGALNESHIVRAIEYWDIERQRRPAAEHRAVIVAEDITARFFNVVRLLNRSVPLIAIKLSSFLIDGNKLVLHPVKVLDVLEEPPPTETNQPGSRDEWAKKSPAMLAIADQMVALLAKTGVQAKEIYNRNHIALVGTGRQFCWLYPRKGHNICKAELRFNEGEADAINDQLIAEGLDTRKHSDFIGWRVSEKDLQNPSPALVEALKQAEAASR